MFNGLQPWHMIILLVVVVLLFGAKRLPDAARSVGKSMKIFRAETKSMGDKDATEDASSSDATSSEPKQLPEASAEDKPKQDDKDEQIKNLQKQLDDLKQHPSENAQK